MPHKEVLGTLDCLQLANKYGYALGSIDGSALETPLGTTERIYDDLLLVLMMVHLLENYLEH